MELAISTLDPAKLVQSLDFEGKGFTSPETVFTYSKTDGKEARLVIRALYHGPRPGFPLLERKTLFDLAQKPKDQVLKSSRSSKIADGRNKSREILCLADKNPEYPIRVLIRIALAGQPGACEDMLKAVRIYSQLYANDYPAFETPVAFWRTLEGIWGVVIDEGSVPLSTWWEHSVQPQIQSSESRWKIGSWRKGEERDGDVKVSEEIEGSSGKGLEAGAAGERRKARFANNAADRDTVYEATEPIQSPEPEKIPSGSHQRRPSDKRRPSDVRAMIGTTESPKIDGTPVNAATGDLREDEKIEISQLQKQEWVARIQQQTQDIQSANGTKHAFDSDRVGIKITPSTKQIGVDEDEEEAMMIDKGWLQAVEILIQLADIVLSLHERRICMVVCRPDFFSISGSQPFFPRCTIPSDTQSISLQLSHFGVIVQMPGFENGKLVGNMNGDFDGDKVIAQGPGSAAAFANFGSNGSRDENEGWMEGEDEGVGALKGVLDEASILRHLQYIAPEAISSRKAIASSVDIFSWGMTAYELLKGKGQEGTESDDSKAEFFRSIHLHSTRAMPTLISLCPSMPSELSALIKKALALDPDDRYSNFCALLHDLHKVKQICDGTLRGSARRDFIVGHIDYQSRFAIPPGLLNREEEFAMLDEVYRLVKMTGRSQVACGWGVSGSGKSKLLETWARRKEADNAGQDCFVSWAKMDQHLVKPLSAFISVFCSLLERVFSDPLESAAKWRQQILDSLAVNANIFLALLPKEWRDILLDHQDSEGMSTEATAGIDWESWVKQFRTWSYGLLRLFASETRPLLIIIDDLQWMERSERELWEELITSETRRLEHCLILFSYRTQDDNPPDLSPFTSKYMIKAHAFSKTVIETLIYKSFHLEDMYAQLPEPWVQLCSYLYKSTQGNPFDLKWSLSTLVHDGDIHYDYARQEWNIQAAVIKASLERSSEDFAASVLNGLSEQSRMVLCHLACLPSRGVSISLLVHLTGLKDNTIRSVLDDCASLGIVTVWHDQVTFVHDKPHTATLALIHPQDKPMLLVKIGKRLEGFSADYGFAQADMLLRAWESDPALLDPLEVARATIRAARQAATSAALDLAASYLDRTENVWTFTSPESWVDAPKLAMEYLVVSSEVALGRKARGPAIPKVTAAFNVATRTSTRLDISAWLFRLHISTARHDLAMQSLFDGLRLLGYDSESEQCSSLPTSEDDIRAIADAPLPPDLEEARTAVALSNLVGTAGPTFYSYEQDKGWRIMRFAVPIYLHNHAAARHPSVAYSWYIMAVLLAEGGAESLGFARAYMDLGETYDLSGSFLEAYAETAKAVMMYVSSSNLGDTDYSRSYEVCFNTKNYDLLAYVLGLDLSTQALSGDSISSLFATGRDVLSSFGDDLQPATRLLTAPWIQFGANLMDGTMFHSKTDVASISVLEGEYVSEQDAENLSHQASFYTAVYAQASLLLGLLFKTSPDDLRRRVALVRNNCTGGAGTILGIFGSILMSITTLVLDDPTDKEQLESTFSWLRPLSHNEDFQAISKMIRVLEAMKAVRQKVRPWSEVVEYIEDALVGLEGAKSHIFAGFLCLEADAIIPLSRSNARLKRGYLKHGQLAFKAAGAVNLVRFIDVLLPILPPSPLLHHGDEKSGTTDVSTLSASEVILSQDITSSLSGSEEVNNINGKDFDPQTQKLGLESILRSFLILASERDSEGLIRRVLQVLLQITCTTYACFATQDPATESLRLKGYGTYKDIKMCDIPISEAKDLAPTVLLSHASITKKPIRLDSGHSSANANLLRREPFFASTGPPKTLLTLPLFVQGRFSGLIFLSGKVSNEHPSTSQVGLLATFAAIILESNQAYATLESAVEIRTQQLQHALHSRSTFISGVSHEIRTPLFAITGLCSVMESSADLTDAQRENLQVISQSAEDLQRIVTAVLDWSKLDARSITPEAIPFDLRNVIENALETVAHLARSKNIKLFLENPVSTDPPMALLGDPHRYRQCLLNLLSNAIKFSNPTVSNQYSTISVSWSWQDHPDKVEITCAVRDEGIGIPAKSMHRLFHSFSQVDSGISRNFGGTGLGLSITRGLARLLGGDCWAESVEGQGSTFYLLVTATKTDRKDAGHSKTFPPGPPRTAVLFAPAGLASSVIQANLQQFGIRTEKGFVDDVAVGSPDFILIDVDESSINADTIKHLRDRYRGCKFIYLITLTEVSSFVKDLALKQEAIVTKPIKALSLYNATKNLDARSNSMSIKQAKKTSAMDSSYAKQYPLKICYIDDSNVNVAVGKKILSKFGYKDVDVCYDGAQAVEAAEKTKYDLMLMDLQMPNMDGHTARKLISENQNIGNPMVVALTANCDQPTKDRCLREGFSDFLTKPLIISDLAKLLERAYHARHQTILESSVVE